MIRKKVIIENRGGHDGFVNGGHFGDWSRVWVSRSEIASVKIARKNFSFSPGCLNYHHHYVEVEVVVNEKNLKDNDYVIIEYRHSHSEKTIPAKFEVLAGKAPKWLGELKETPKRKEIEKRGAIALISPKMVK